MKKLLLCRCMLQLALVVSGTFTLRAALAGEQAMGQFEKAIVEAGDEKSLAKGLESAGEQFLKEHKYDAYVAFLKAVPRADGLGKALVNYYVGQTRLSQLKYLEESQQWEEYFNQGTQLRAEAVESIAGALQTSAPDNAVTLYAHLLMWQFHKDQQDSSQAEGLAALSQSAKSYAESGKDPEPLKRSADLLMAYDEKMVARELYRLYFRKISAAGMTDDQLFSSASGFLKEGNLELAESAFNAYLEKVGALPKAQAVPLLLRVAGELAYRRDFPGDPAYAEKVFGMAEAAGGSDVFDEDTLYMRAFNLEAGEEFIPSFGNYQLLVSRFPQGKYRDEALYKSAMIALYVKRDPAEAEQLFGKVAAAEPAVPLTVPALYQLGLMKQWQQEFAAAKQFYAEAREKAGDSYPETSALLGQRMKELEESKPITFALKSFLDTTLGEDGALFDMSKAAIKTPSSIAAKGEQVTFSASALPGESGCTQVVLSQYWSGDLGASAPAGDQAVFSTAYNEGGVKVINLLVLTPAGVVDRAVKILNVK